MNILCLWVIASKKTPSSKCFPTTSFPWSGFHQIFSLFHKKYFIKLLLPWSEYLRSIMHFQRKASFFLTHCWSVLILLFCLFLFFTGIYSSAITKLRINKLFFSSLSIWPLIKSCDITKEFMVWKLQVVFVFDFRGN